jgi:hypothetical protein
MKKTLVFVVTAMALLCAAVVPVAALDDGSASMVSAAIPSKEWVLCTGGIYPDAGYSTRQTDDGGYILAGYTESLDGDMTGAGYHGGGDACAAKFSARGEVLWMKCVGGTGDDAGYSVQQTTDGGYVLFGYTNSTNGNMTGAGNHGGGDAFMARLNATGSVLWVKCVGGSSTDTGQAVQQTTDGGYVLAGYTNSTDGSMMGAGNHGGGDAFIAKMNATGTVLWVTCVGGSSSDTGQAVQQTMDGGYVLTGYTNSTDGDMAGAGYHGGGDAFVARLNATGTVLWVTCVGGTGPQGEDRGNSVQQAADGSYILAGETFSSDGDMGGAGYHGGGDAFVANLSAAGSVQWVRCVGGTGADKGWAVQGTMKGDYILAGYTNSSDGDMAHSRYHGGGDAFVTGLSAAGMVEWTRCTGGSGTDSGRAVQQTADGGYLLAGITESSNGDMINTVYHMNGDAFMAKFSASLGKIGVFTNGQWFMDANSNGTWEGQPPDRATSFGFAGVLPVISDWDGDTKSEVGVFKGGQWYVDVAGRPYLWDGTVFDQVYSFGIPGDLPVVGDWNSDNEPEIGVYRDGVWFLDANRNDLWDGTGPGLDAMYFFGAGGFAPVVGDWNRDGLEEIGAYTGTGTWYADASRNHLWDGTGPGKDAILNFGFPGALPVVGDWNQDGIFEIGVCDGAGTFYLDASGNNRWDGTGPGKDIEYTFGITGLPVAGDWT